MRLYSQSSQREQCQQWCIGRQQGILMTTSVGAYPTRHRDDESRSDIDLFHIRSFLGHISWSGSIVPALDQRQHSRKTASYWSHNTLLCLSDTRSCALYHTHQLSTAGCSRIQTGWLSRHQWTYQWGPGSDHSGFLLHLSQGNMCDFVREAEFFKRYRYLNSIGSLGCIEMDIWSECHFLKTWRMIPALVKRKWDISLVNGNVTGRCLFL